MTSFPVNSYVDLVRDASLHGRSFGIYCHKLGDPLPPLQYSYSDPRTVCSSVLLQLEDKRWIFVSNAKSGIRDSLVRLYCSSSIQFIFPLDDQLKDLLVHFFPSKNTLQVFHCSDSSTNDSDGLLTSLLNLYCTIITDRSVKYNILADCKISDQTRAAFHESVEKKRLLRFTDNECYSVFIPTHEVTPPPAYSIEYVTAAELEQKRWLLPDNLQLSDSSDDDFEVSRPSKKQKLATEDIPKFVSPSKADKLKSRKRLDSIRGLVENTTKQEDIKRQKVVTDGQTSIACIEAIMIPGVHDSSDLDDSSDNQRVYTQNNCSELISDGQRGCIRLLQI